MRYLNLKNLRKFVKKFHVIYGNLPNHFYTIFLFQLIKKLNYKLTIILFNKYCGICIVPFIVFPFSFIFKGLFKR